MPYVSSLFDPACVTVRIMRFLEFSLKKYEREKHEIIFTSPFFKNLAIITLNSEAQKGHQMPIFASKTTDLDSRSYIQVFISHTYKKFRTTNPNYDVGV